MGKSARGNRYDFLVAGGGTAGLTVAAHLAQAGFSVAVFEAGANDSQDPQLQLPGSPQSSNLAVPSSVNLYFMMMGHSTNQNAGNKSFPLIGGRVLGGGSSVNGLQFVRGTAAFYDSWKQQAGGDPAWGTENAKVIFKELETFYGVPGYFDPSAHGTQGPLSVRQAVKYPELAQQFVQAVRQLGFPIIKDYNAPGGAIGAFKYWQLTETPLDHTKNAKSDANSATAIRSSSQSAFLPQDQLTQLGPNLYSAYQGRLHLYLQSYMSRLVFDDNDHSRVKGLTVIVNGSELRFRAHKEVIMAAGINSARLLLASGVGPRHLLQEAQVPVMLDVPMVGQRGLNHPILSLSGTGPNPNANLKSQDTSALYSGGAFLPRFVDRNQGQEAPRAFEIICVGDPVNPGLAGLVLDADSPSEMRVLNSDPLNPGRFTFNYLQTPADQERAFELYTYLWHIAKNMGLTLDTSLLPDPSNPSNKLAIQAYITKTYSQAYHYTGWLRMGTSSVDSAVSPEGLVWGTNNLRCVDNDIVPLNPLGNTQATAYFAAIASAKKIIQKYQWK